jgi:hypothetical protein
LLPRLTRENRSQSVGSLVDALIQLDPTVHDLRPWREWTAPPTEELLAAARENSTVDEWLAGISALTSLSL